jgi:hypothetical protein
MSEIDIRVRRKKVVSSRPFDEVVTGLTATIGMPDMESFRETMAAARNLDELERIVQGAIGPSRLMEFVRFDMGEILRKGTGETTHRILRFLIGNPLIMKSMAELVHDAASYAPLTILVDERADGVHLSYDLMADFLGPYENEAAIAIARDLDAKVESLIAIAAG